MARGIQRDIQMLKSNKIFQNEITEKTEAAENGGIIQKALENTDRP